MPGAILPVGRPVIQRIPVLVHYVFAVALVSLTGADQGSSGRIAVLPLLHFLWLLLILGLGLTMGGDLSRGLPAFHLLPFISLIHHSVFRALSCCID